VLYLKPIRLGSLKDILRSLENHTNNLIFSDLFIINFSRKLLQVTFFTTVQKSDIGGTNLNNTG